MKKREFIQTKKELEEFMETNRYVYLLFFVGFLVGMGINLLNWEIGGFVDYTLFFITLLSGIVFLWVFMNYRYGCIAYRIYGYEKQKLIAEEKE